MKGDQSEPERMRQEFQQRRDVFVKGLNQIKGSRAACRKARSIPFRTSSGTAGRRRNWPMRCWMKREWRDCREPRLARSAKGYMRFSIANSIEKLEQALDRIEQWTKKNL